MCGRFTVLTRAEVEAAVRAVEGRQALAPLASGSARTQARPRQVVPVFTEVFDIKDLVWGFMFPWSKSPVFNTRIESILSDSATWREAVREGRCVIPAAGFFEPHATETVPSPRTGKAIKRPYEFAAVDGAPLLMAGVSADGCCSVVTTQPNASVSPVHDRMPLLLRADEVDAWFAGDFAALADRSAFSLAVHPETLAQTEVPPVRRDPDQLSLF